MTLRPIVRDLIAQIRDLEEQKAELLTLRDTLVSLLRLKDQELTALRARCRADRTEWLTAHLRDLERVMEGR